MKRHFKLGLLFSAIAAAFGLATGIKNNSKGNQITHAESGDTFYRDTSFTRMWNTSNAQGAVPNYDKTTNTGGFTFEDDFCTSSTQVESGRWGIGDSDGEIYLSAPKGLTYAINALYVPFYAKIDVPANCVFRKNYSIELKINLPRYGSYTNNYGSLELFYFNDEITTETAGTTKPSNLYYCYRQTGNLKTGIQYSVYRICGQTTASVSSRTKSVNCNFVYTNSTNSTRTVYLHFGVLMYIELADASSNSFNSTVKIKKSETTTETNPIVTKVSTNKTNEYVYFDNIHDAIEQYNTQGSGRLYLMDNVALTQNEELTRSSGDIYLLGYTITCESYQFIIKGATVVHGTGTISGSCNGGVFKVDVANSSLRIVDGANVTGSGSSVISMTENCIGTVVDIESQSSTAVTIKSTSTDSSACVISLGAGKVYARGYINRMNNDADAIRCADNNINKQIYISGYFVITGLIKINRLSDTELYGSLNGSGRANMNDYIKVYSNYQNTLSNGDVVVKNVPSDETGFIYYDPSNGSASLIRSGNNLVYQKNLVYVNFDLTNMSKNSGDTTARRGTDYTCRIKPDYNYTYPESIIIYVADAVMATSSYNYNSSNGNITIYGNSITDNITVKASGIKKVTISFANPETYPYMTAKDDLQGVEGDVVIFGTPIYNNPKYKTFGYWSINADGSGTCYYADTEYTLTANVMMFAIYIQTDADKVNEFVGIQLHFDEDVIETSNNSETDACKGENGYYQIAKTAFSSLTADQKELFMTDSKYAEAKARMIAWAAANGETFDNTTYSFGSPRYGTYNELSIDKDSSVIVLFLTTSVAFVGVAAIYFLKKKKAVK